MHYAATVRTYELINGCYQIKFKKLLIREIDLVGIASNYVTDNLSNLEHNAFLSGRSHRCPWKIESVLMLRRWREAGGAS